MPICIECCYPVSHLYTTYSKADDRALGKGVRLTQCPRCQRFADKYVEHDFVVLFIDLVLIKPQVYRHLLFNRLGREDDKFDRSIIRLGTLILLFDVYLSWARLEKSSALASSSLANAPIVVQYVFFLALNTLATLAHHLAVRLLAAYLVLRPAQHGQQVAAQQHASLNGNGNGNGFGSNDNAAGNGNGTNEPFAPSTSTLMTPAAEPSTSPSRPSSSGGTAANSNNNNNNLSTTTTASSSSLPPPPPPPLIRRSSTAPLRIKPIPPPTPSSANAISTALLVSSCTKLFPILLVIWGADNNNNNNNNNNNTSPDTTTTTTTTPTPPPHSLRKIITQSLSSAASAAATTSSNPSSSSSTPTLSTSLLDPLLSLVLSITNTHLVLLNNTEALFILLDCGYVRAAAMALTGQFARWVVERALLGLVGL